MRKSLSVLGFLLVLALFFQPFSTPVLAAATESTQVSATVGEVVPSPTPTPPPADLIPPSAPIQLFLDGELYIDNIIGTTPVIVVPAISELTEGTHTWFVKVFDNAGNFAFSTTWHFTVDTIPPFIIITAIEETPNLNFSSIDLSTVPPGTTITTYSHRPVFFGRGEPGATIQINLEDKKSYQFITKVSDDGSFVVIPDQDIANDTYEVTIISFDKAGNTTLLPTFKLIVQAPPKIVFPLCWLIVLLLLIIIAILSYLYYRERKRHQEHHRKPLTKNEKKGS